MLTAAHPALGIDSQGLAFGLTVLTMAYAVGHVSSCHLNPAVSVGIWAGGRFPARDLPGYIAAQVLGGIASAAILYAIASGHPGFDLAGGFASNGYSTHSPSNFTPAASLIWEFVTTFGFLSVVMGSAHGNAPHDFAPLAIGLCLTLIRLISIPVTNTAVNSARSTAPAPFEGG